MAKAGFVTIIGRPNVGKSTLMNTAIGQKIAITSYKPQTTRKRMLTVCTEERGQIVFLDTPGMNTTEFSGKNHLSRYMERAAEGTLGEVDLVLYLVEPRKTISAEDRMILQLLRATKTPVFLVINKADTVKKDQLLETAAVYAAEYEFREVFPVSARNRSGMDELITSVFDALPEGEPFYDEDTITNVNERELAEEIIREKALRLLQEEVPHGIAVQVQSMKYRQGRNGEICDIDADIITERESHKAIIIGKGGEMLKKIGTDARTDIENLIDSRVNLKLWVKVRNSWRDDDRQLKNLGYDQKQLKDL